MSRRGPGVVRTWFYACDLRCHPSKGAPGPGRRSLNTVETGDAGEAKIVDTRSTRLVNEDVALKWRW